MKKLILSVMALPLLLVSCQQDSIENEPTEVNKMQLDDVHIIDLKIDPNVGSEIQRVGKNDDDAIKALMNTINSSLQGSSLLLEKIEFIGANEAGRTVFFKNVGNKQISSDFVVNDPRNVGGTMVPYFVDAIQLGTSSGMSPLATFNAIYDSMSTWESQTCSEGLMIPFIGLSTDYGIGDAGFVQAIVGYGGYPGYIPGTILHAGILPPDFFEFVLGPGAGNGTVGVTFTFTWTDDETGEPTDIDNNGKSDVAIKEIYYNDNFNYQDAPNDQLFDPQGVIDFQTIVLHEVGHGLSQGHFGTAFRDKGLGQLHFAPAALMNAGYTVGRRDITGTDASGHCSIWGNWPTN